MNISAAKAFIPATHSRCIGKLPDAHFQPQALISIKDSSQRSSRKTTRRTVPVFPSPERQGNIHRRRPQFHAATR